MLEVARCAAVVLWVYNKGQRHLEHLGDLERVDGLRERHLDDADDRRDLEAGPSHIGVEPADHRNMVARQPDLFLGLAQRRLVGSASLSSMRPPGNAICPACTAKCAVRCVSSTDMPSGRSTRGTSTAAGRKAALGSVIPGLRS